MVGAYTERIQNHFEFLKTNIHDKKQDANFFDDEIEDYDSYCEIATIIHEQEILEEEKGIADFDYVPLFNALENSKLFNAIKLETENFEEQQQILRDTIECLEDKLERSSKSFNCFLYCKTELDLIKFNLMPSLSESFKRLHKTEEFIKIHDDYAWHIITKSFQEIEGEIKKAEDELYSRSSGSLIFNKIYKIILSITSNQNYEVSLENYNLLRELLESKKYEPDAVNLFFKALKAQYKSKKDLNLGIPQSLFDNKSFKEWALVERINGTYIAEPTYFFELKSEKYFPEFLEHHGQEYLITFLEKFTITSESKDDHINSIGYLEGLLKKIHNHPFISGFIAFSCIALLYNNSTFNTGLNYCIQFGEMTIEKFNDFINLASNNFNFSLDNFNLKI